MLPSSHIATAATSAAESILNGTESLAASWAKRKDETLRRQFHHVKAQAFPDGHPQERAVGFVHFLNKYGPTLIDRLLEELPPDIGIHWVITP